MSVGHPSKPCCRIGARQLAQLASGKLPRVSHGTSFALMIPDKPTELSWLLEGQENTDKTDCAMYLHRSVTEQALLGWKISSTCSREIKQLYSTWSRFRFKKKKKNTAFSTFTILLHSKVQKQSWGGIGCAMDLLSFTLGFYKSGQSYILSCHLPFKTGRDFVCEA